MDFKTACIIFERKIKMYLFYNSILFYPYMVIVYDFFLLHLIFAKNNWKWPTPEQQRSRRLVLLTLTEKTVTELLLDARAVIIRTTCP